MCGFAGFYLGIQSDDNDLNDAIVNMSNALEHRGPDDSGKWFDAKNGFALGHRRLAIVDTSASGHQPMTSLNNQYVIALNGEIYNHSQLRAELELVNHKIAWKGHSDTETLLAAFEYWGIEETLKKAVGMFAIALWETASKRLYLIRDRFGEKPLYYGWIDDGQQEKVFAFGSELKAFKAYPRFSNSVCRVALKQYFRYMYVPSPYSIYKDIYKLEAGCMISLEGSPPLNPFTQILHPLDGTPQTHQNLTMSRWYSLKEKITKNSKLHFEDDAGSIHALEEQLIETIKIQSEADVPLGAFLSGGVDSSTIVALMQENQSNPVQTFTIGFEDKKFDESPYALAVAKHLGTDHHELFVSSGDAQSLIPDLPKLYDEPFADSSQIPTHFVSMAAKKKVTVSLSGDAGDELFGGYNRYLFAPKLWDKVKWMPFSARKAMGNSLALVPIASWDKIAYAFNKLNPGSLSIAQLGDKVHKTALRFKTVQSIDELYKNLVCEWPNVDELVISSEINHHALNIINTLEDPLPEMGMDDAESRMMYWDSMTYMTDDILCKVDRAAMGVSLETRVPFLDHRIVELAWQMPLQTKIKNNQGKWPLRQILYKRVPKELIERPKAGFGIPLGDWLRGPMREWAEALIEPERLTDEGFLNPELVRVIWNEHQEQKRNWSFKLWSILMFQSWLEYNK